MLTLSIITIFALMADYSFHRQYLFVERQTIIEQLRNELVETKTRAILQQQLFSYCAAQPPDWAGERQVSDQQGAIIHQYKRLPVRYELTLRNSLHRNDCVRFTPLGFTAEQRGSFYLKSPVGDVRLIMGLTGTLRESSIDEAIN